MLIFDLSLSRSGALVQKAPYNQATALTYNTVWTVKSVKIGPTCRSTSGAEELMQVERDMTILTGLTLFPWVL